MRKTTYIALLHLILCSAVLGADAGFTYLKPSTFDASVKLTVAGKQRTYFVLDKESQVSAVVEGPSQLKVISRLELSDPAAQPDYTIEVRIEGSKRVRSIHHTSKLSEKVENPDAQSQLIGVLRSKIIDIPSGKHTVNLRLPEGSTGRVFVRLSQKTNEFTGGTPVIAMTPVEFTSEIELISDEVSYAYYRIGGTDRAALRLVGPATLKVLSRIEFTPEMKGTQKWKIAVIEDGKLKKTYSLSAGSSDVTQYKTKSSKVASRAETFFVEIPEGEHIYEFRMHEDTRTALLRFLLPKTELTNGKSQ